MAKIKGMTSCAALIVLVFLLGPVAGAVTAGQPDAPDLPGFNESQALTDSTLRDIRGKGSLIGFGNGLTDVATQVNQGSGTQTSTINGTALSGPGTQVQTLPSHISTTLQSLQRLFERWRR
jgi:hypothetical protein